MNELVLANRAADWRRLKMLVLDSVSSPIYARSAFSPRWSLLRAAAAAAKRHSSRKATIGSTLDARRAGR